jgi:tetratricopeptide (TPR) repeat protein
MSRSPNRRSRASRSCGWRSSRIAADLDLGLHAELVGELEALVADHPLRERLRGLLMLALYRSGRQAEALEAYADARHALVEQLGIEPGRELQELQRAVLAQDPSLDPRPATAPAPTEDHRLLVGRERELGLLTDTLERAMAGHGGVALVSGEPGIGKSRLADEIVARARARGARALWGRCWEAGGAPAFWPWVQSLRAYVREMEPEALREQLGAGAADLAPLLPELHELIADLPEPPPLDPESARFRLFEAASSFLRSATQARPLVLVLDDLHAADEPSLLLLEFVAREIADSRLLVICAFRDVDPTIAAPLASALAQLVREPQTSQIALTGLGEPDVAEYLELATGVEPEPRLTRAIHAETKGNPLFVSEVVRLLDAEGRLAEADAHLRIPPGVSAVIGRRVGRLSERCRDLLVPAAVLGREFGLDALARLGELPGGELLDVLDEAMAERVIGDVPGSPGRLRFGHALIRDTLYDELTPVRRLRLHRRTGEALEAVYSAALEPHLAELAHHFCAAAPAGDADKAIEYARRAGDHAASQLAYEEAVRLYEMALALAADGITRCDLLLALADAQSRSGDTPGANLTCLEAGELADRLALPERLVRAAAGYGGRMMWEVARGDRHYLSLAERALAVIGEQDSVHRVRLLARLASGPLRDSSFPPERKASLSREALEMARRIGDTATVAYALVGYITSRHSPEFSREQLRVATELVEVATEAGDQERALEGHESRLLALVEFGEMSDARVELESIAQLAERLRQPAQLWAAIVYRALMALLEGRFVEAESLISEAFELGERPHAWNAAVTFRLQLYVLRREQGRLEEVEGLVRRSVTEYPTYAIWRCVLAHMATELGLEAEAREVFEALAADGFRRLPFDEEWLVSLSLLAEIASALGHAPGAAALYEQLLPWSGRVGVSYPEISTGSVARYLGLLAAMLGRPDDAGRHFEDALEMNRRIGARPWLARTQLDYAAMLLARDGESDAARARQMLESCIETAAVIGMRPVAVQASALRAHRSAGAWR